MRDSCVSKTISSKSYFLYQVSQLFTQKVKYPASITHKCGNLPCIYFCPARYFTKQEMPVQNQHSGKKPCCSQSRDTETLHPAIQNSVSAQFTPKLLHGKASRNTQWYWCKICKDSQKSVCSFLVLQVSQLTVSFSPPMRWPINGF